MTVPDDGDPTRVDDADPTGRPLDPTRFFATAHRAVWTVPAPADHRPPLPTAPPPTPRPEPDRIVRPVMAGPFPASWLRPSSVARSLAYLVSGALLSTGIFAVVLGLAAIAVGLTVSLVLAAVSLPFWWALFGTSRSLGRLERWRTAALFDTTIDDPVPLLQARGPLRRLRERFESGARWRELAHHLVALPVQATLAWAALTGWVWCIALLTAPVRHRGGGTVSAGPVTVRSEFGVAVALLAGLAGLVLAPLLTVGLARLELGLAKLLLGPATQDELNARLVQAEGSREAAVDSAEAERRRIERDLHDGAQQRLVALAAGLGVARDKLDRGGDPDESLALVAEAHEEAKAALKEIRDLVRGIHPVILEDRGLDAALSAVVARAPVPVSLDVRVQPRPPAAVESAAYFVVSEALTNVARHARATRAQVAIARAGDRLVVEVLDDGVGGADASLGTGLQGLRERVTGMGGTLHVISPAGGPTTLSVELPCAS